MAVQTTEEFKNGGATSYATTIEYLKESDIIVEIDASPLTYVASNPSSGEYTVSGTTVTLGAQAAAGSGNVHIYRETNVNVPAAVFSVGSSIRASDLNAIHDMARFAAVEHRNQIITANIKDGQITSAKIKDGTIVNDDINASADIDNSKIADGLLKSGITVNGSNIVNDSIDSQHYAALSIDTEHIAYQQVTTAKLAPQAVTTGKIVNDAVTTDKIANDAVTNAKLANDSVNHNQIQTDAVRTSEIQNHAVTTSKIADLNVTGSKIASLTITGSKIASNTIGGDKIAASAIDTVELANNAVTAAKISDAVKVTDSEQSLSTPDNETFFTTAAAEARYFNASTGETIKNGQTFPDNDTTIATTAAINDRIIDLVDDVGGFVPIANETSFPTSNPDVNNGTGTIVSISAASTNLVPSGTTVTIANGRGSGLPVVITGVSATIPSGFGFLVETTTTAHTYTFHRLVPIATQVETVANNITNIVNAGANVADIHNFADVYQISTSAPTARQDTTSLQIGDLWFDSSSNKVLMIYDNSSGDGFTAATPNASDLVNINIVAGQITYQEDLGLITNAVNTGSGNNSVNTVATDIANVNTAATNIAKINTVADDLNEGTSEIDTVATNIANVNTVGNNISNVNAVANNSSNINSAVSNASNINSAVSNQSNINAAVSNATNINAVAGNNSNVTTVAGSISNVNTAATNIASINTTAASIANVNNFTDRYQVASSNPSTDGGGNALAEGDLYFNTSANELKVYTGSAWQGGVTASGNFAAVTGNTFTGNNTYNDNVKARFGTGGDVQIYWNGTSGFITNQGGGNLHLNSNTLLLKNAANNKSYIRAYNNSAVELYHNNTKKFETTSTGAEIFGLMTATTIDGAAGDNLQLDFGTL